MRGLHAPYKNALKYKPRQKRVTYHRSRLSSRPTRGGFCSRRRALGPPPEPCLGLRRRPQSRAGRGRPRVLMAEAHPDCRGTACDRRRVPGSRGQPRNSAHCSCGGVRAWRPTPRQQTGGAHRGAEGTELDLLCFLHSLYIF